MPNGRERVDELVREAAAWERADTKWDRMEARSIVDESAQAIAADLDKLEKIRKAATKVSVTKSIHGPDVFLGFEELLAAIGGHSDRT